MALYFILWKILKVLIATFTTMALGSSKPQYFTKVHFGTVRQYLDNLG
jgi:hypothetical protein